MNVWKWNYEFVLVCFINFIVLDWKQPFDYNRSHGPHNGGIGGRQQSPSAGYDRT